jgi:hypothetical protein
MAHERTILSSVAVLAVALAGCGRASSPAHGRGLQSSAQVLNLVADPSGDYDFIPKSLSARAGTVVVELFNPMSTAGPHGIAIRGHGVHAIGRSARRGDVSHVTARLKPGRYQVYSPVDGDAQNGMTESLTVRADRS